MGSVGQNGKPRRVAPDCDADHWTDEERAVVEASLRLRRAETAVWIEVGTGVTATEAQKERRQAYSGFVTSCDRLIATRKERNDS